MQVVDFGYQFTFVNFKSILYKYSFRQWDLDELLIFVFIFPEWKVHIFRVALPPPPSPSHHFNFMFIISNSCAVKGFEYMCRCIYYYNFIRLTISWLYKRSYPIINRMLTFQPQNIGIYFKYWIKFPLMKHIYSLHIQYFYNFHLGKTVLMVIL